MCHVTFFTNPAKMDILSKIVPSINLFIDILLFISSNSNLPRYDTSEEALLAEIEQEYEL